MFFFSEGSSNAAQSVFDYTAKCPDGVAGYLSSSRSSVKYLIWKP